MMSYMYNFSAGPATLPIPVRAKIQKECFNWHGTGLSPMEMSHRGKEFIEIVETIRAHLNTLLQIPDNYTVLFLHGGATAQFEMVPMNLLTAHKKADYAITGSWSKKACAMAQRFGDIHTVINVNSAPYEIPDFSTWQVRDDAAYLHYVSNETIHGIEYPFVPKCPGVPLVVDMSSNILSKPISIEDYGLIYAGAQKNLGIAGVTLVIVRNDLITSLGPNGSEIHSYAAQQKAESIMNTPATFSWYVLGLVLEWILEEGGLEVIEARNKTKADLLYHAIDASSYFNNAVHPANRSRMNVPFQCADEADTPRFIEYAERNGLAYLQGHRNLGGMRASIYNAMPLEGVQRLIEVMQDFEKNHA